jgi:hypothetical protein
MDRHICFLLAIPLAFFVSPSLYAQHGSGGGQGRGHGGGQSGSGGLSGHSVGHSLGQSLGHMFGHHPGKGGSQFEKGPGSRGGELPPLAGAAFVHGKVVMLPSPSMALDGQPRHTVRGQFAAGFAPHKPFGANPFDPVFAILSVAPGIAFCFRTTLTASGILSFHIASSPGRSTDTFGLIPCLPACQAPPPSRWNRRRLRILPG